MRASLLLLVRSISISTSILVAGCGARTMLDFDPSDGARPQPDAGTDAGIDSGPPDAGGLIVECGRSEQYTAPRLLITLEGSASSPDGIVAQGWELVSSPPGSSPILAGGTDPRIIGLVPDVEGAFEMRFSARDGAGRGASCDVTVRSIVGPPVAICPEGELATTIGVPITIVGDGFDDERVVDYAWELVSFPPGAAAELTSDGPVLVLRSDTRGYYLLRLFVMDADGATGSCEVTVRVTGPPEVSCGEPTIRTPTRRPVTLRATATDDVGIARRFWDMLERPSGSTAAPVPPDAETTTMTPDKRGTYRLRFTAVDMEGLSATCEVTVIGTPTPPEVTCPAEVSTPPLAAVNITASAVDDGTIVSWRWRLELRPEGSAARPPAPLDRPVTRFTPDIAGIYSLVVTATDDDAMTGTCTTRVLAGNIDGLRIEMFWDTDGTDMDTHLLNPTGRTWAPSDDDCYYANCNVSAGRNLEWGAAGNDDNPRLDIDDTNGFGPENINITRPVPGTYRVAVHDYRSDRANRVTVRIYCGGSTTSARATFGPATLNRRGTSSGSDFWRVADVTIVSPTDCTVTDLSRSGAPWIEDYATAVTRR